MTDLFFLGTQILILGSVVYAIRGKISGHKKETVSWFSKAVKDAFRVLIVVEILLWILMFVNAGGNLDDTLDGYTYLWGITHFTGIILAPSIIALVVMIPIRYFAQSRKQL